MPALNPAEGVSRPRLPEWLRIRLPTTESFARTRSLLDELKLAFQILERLDRLHLHLQLGDHAGGNTWQESKRLQLLDQFLVW